MEWINKMKQKHFHKNKKSYYHFHPSPIWQQQGRLQIPKLAVLATLRASADVKSHIIISIFCGSKMQRLLQMGNIQPRIFLRFIILSLVSMGYLLNRFMYKPYTTECLHDAWHQFTQPLNEGLDHDGKDNMVIGIGQVFMDFWIVAISVFWMIKLKNARIVFAAGIFFLIRSIFLNVSVFPFPEHLVWHNPGFPSLTVPYDRTRDFFFSGHTGSLTVIIIEFYTVGYKWFTVIPFICLFYMMNMLLVTRVHYTIDVAGGLVFAIFISKFIGKYLFYLDWLLSFPLLAGKIALRKYRESKTKRQTLESMKSLEERLQSY